MVTYLMDWIYNVLVTLATVSGVGLLGYAGLRQFYPATMLTIQNGLQTAASWVSGINLWPVVALVVLFAVMTITLPAPRQRV